MKKPSAFSLPCPGLLGFALGVGLALLRFGMASGWGADPYWGWVALGVPAMEIPFGDLDTGICKAYAFLQEGRDPYTDGSYNARGILSNYPPLLLHTLGPVCVLLGSSWGLGWLLGLVAVAVFALLSFRMPLWAGLAMGLGLGFGGPALAFERGNTDLFLVPLVALAAWLPFWLVRIRPAAGTGLFALLIWLSTMLKLFPVMALAAGLAFPVRRFRLLGLMAGAVAAGMYVLTDFALISVLLDNTPVSYLNSYGIQTTLLYLGMGEDDAVLVRFGMSFVASGVAFQVFWNLFRQARDGRSAPEADLPRYALCLAGGAIFCGTYLASANYEYRLIFALLCLPYVFARPGRWYVGTGLALLVFTAWPALEAAVRPIAWGGRIEMASFFARQALGLGLVGMAMGWLFWQAFVQLLGIPAPARARRRAK